MTYERTPAQMASRAHSLRVAIVEMSEKIVQLVTDAEVHGKKFEEPRVEDLAHAIIELAVVLRRELPEAQS